MLVDSHCHLDAAEFDVDRAEVIARAIQAGVTRQIVPAVTAADWPKLRAVCEADDRLHPAYGLHPMFLASYHPRHLDELRQWIERESPVAVGECGLDYFVDGLDRDLQMTCFQAQLTLAREFDLPVIVHARKAVDAVTMAIRAIGGLRGVVHSFSGSQQQAENLWEQGFLLGLGGPVTYPRANRLRKLAATMPLEWLLLETDAPDQPDAAHRGKRNEPARLTHVLQTIADLREVAPAEVAAATTANAERLFRLPPTRKPT
ncbi:TatD family hydrolase [Lysobacter sp. A289]